MKAYLVTEPFPFSSFHPINLFLTGLTLDPSRETTDDFLLFSGSHDEHRQLLTQFYDIVQSHGIMLSAKKSTIATNNIEFLGMIIKDGHYQPGKHIAQELRHFPYQQLSKKQVQQFLGIVNYIRDFILHVDHYTHHLSALLKKKSPEWNADHTNAITTLKKIAQNPPPLKSITDGKRTLQTDASDDSWGAILLEEINGKEHFIAYARGQFSDTQKHYHRSHAEHRQLLTQFYDIVQSQGIMLSAKKSTIATNNIEFLGMIIKDGHYQPGKHIAQELLHFPYQQLSKKQVQQFLGIINYIRDFILHVDHYTHHLSALLKKKPPEWNADHTNTVTTLKKIAQNPPPLKSITDGKRTFQTDGSDDSWGAILLEEINGKEHFIAYASGQFSDTQKHYHSVFKEILAVKNGIKKFEYHLIGHHFLIRMDSSAFPNILNFKGKTIPEKMLLRLEDWFSKYDFSVKHIKGSQNLIPDMLSRLSKPANPLTLFSTTYHFPIISMATSLPPEALTKKTFPFNKTFSCVFAIQEFARKALFRFFMKAYLVTEPFPFSSFHPKNLFHTGLTLDPSRETTNDLLLFSGSHDEHRQLLTQFYDIVQSHGIMLSAKKSTIATNNIEFLGMIIKDGHYQPGKHIAQELLHFPDQQLSKKQVQQFLGIINYIRDFILHVDHYTHHLSALLKKKPPEWNADHTNTVTTLKKIAQNPPPLKSITDGQRTLQTDASDDSWGAILLEEINGKEHFIAYASGQFSDTQKHYHNVFKEILAVKNGIKKFEYHLIGHRFLIHMDSSAFPNILNFKGKTVPEKMLLRLKDWFSKYDFSVKHIKGSQNLIPDMLSRLSKPANPLTLFSTTYHFPIISMATSLPPEALTKKTFPFNKTFSSVFAIQEFARKALFRFFMKAYLVTEPFPFSSFHPKNMFLTGLTLDPSRETTEDVLWYIWCLTVLYATKLVLPITPTLEHLLDPDKATSLTWILLEWFSPIPWWRKKLQQLSEIYNLDRMPASEAPLFTSVFIIHSPYFQHPDTNLFWTQDQVYEWFTTPHPAVIDNEIQDVLHNYLCQLNHQPPPLKDIFHTSLGPQHDLLMIPTPSAISKPKSTGSSSQPPQADTATKPSKVDKATQTSPRPGYRRDCPYPPCRGPHYFRRRETLSFMASTSSSTPSTPVTLSSTLSLPKSCSSHTTNKIENLVEYSYIPESAQISESSYPLLNPYHLYKRPSSFTRSIRTLISTRRPHPKEYIQSSRLDQCSLQETPAEQYVTLEIPSKLVSNWKREGYIHLHLGGIRLILTLHGRKGLPVTARITMLDTRFKQHQDAVIGTVLTTLHAGSVLLTFYPNFNLSLQDTNLPTALKVQVQIQGAEQISSAKIATLHHQLVYRLQNHALDLPTPEHHSDTLMVLAESDQIPTIIQIPRQIPRHELIKLMPLEWISNYEQFHTNIAPIQTSESMFERRQDGTTAQEDLPITGFNSEGYPVYPAKHNGHFLWDVPGSGPTYHPFASMLSPIRQYDPSKLFGMTHTLFRDNPLPPPPKPKPKSKPQPRPVTFHQSSDTIKSVRGIVIPELQQLKLFFGPVVRKLGFPADIPL
ncbi:hypothetical protein KPL71_021626 [Citrus sinensis]|nr:hypothetical protein KPL71_021626 [Citrus sinensis]